MRAAAPVPCNRRGVAVFSMSLRGAKRRGNPYSCGRAWQRAALRANTEKCYGLAQSTANFVMCFCWDADCHRCAHWFAMTCRRRTGVSECKDVPTVIARREATRQSALLAVRHDGKQYFGQMRRNCEFALGTAGFFCKMFGSKFFHFGTRREGNRTEEEKKRTERKVEEAEEGGLGG